MRKMMLLALAAVVATAIGATPDKKKKKSKKTDAQTVIAAPPATFTDSLSYAAGQARSHSLAYGIEHEFGVDTAHVSDYIDGYAEAVRSLGDPQYAARLAGAYTAAVVEKYYMKKAQEMLDTTKHTFLLSQYNNGFIAGVKGDTTVMTLDEARAFYYKVVEADEKAKSEAYRTENENWLKANAAKEGVKTTASGLQYKVITAGDGAVPTAKDRVTVRYEGRLIDGTVFDSSYRRTPNTNTFGVNHVIKGWTEALTMMPVGSKWELYIPHNLGYGRSGAGDIKPYSTLIFTVELISIEKSKTAADKE